MRDGGWIVLKKPPMLCAREVLLVKNRPTWKGAVKPCKDFGEYFLMGGGGGLSSYMYKWRNGQYLP